MAENLTLTEKRFVELFGKLFEKHAKGLDLATNSMVKAEIEKSRKLIVESRDLLLKDVHKGVDTVIDHIDNLELNTVKRSEFEALKRQVERLMAH